VKAFEIQKSFGLDSLAAVDRPDAIPGPGQVVVRMKAVSLNYRDLLMVRGHYYPKQPLPLIPLSDGAGEVVLVGDGVTRAKAGDRVMAIFAQRWISGEPTKAKLLSALGGPLDGTLCEEMVLDEEGLVHVPPHLSWEEAATLPCAAVTSWSALVTEGGIEPGDTVLVLGTGGVSIFALQIARLRALGAAETINYLATPDWEKRVRELTEGTGADHVIEVGGGGTFARSVRAVRVGGQISLIGVLAGNTTEVNLAPILMQNIRVQGVIVGSRETFEDLNGAVSSHQLRPVVDRVFPFAEARGAFDHMAGQGHFGKIVLRM
jgi:NADPH:quinone reductase-like Zn-dependent oxidoreductase